MSGITINTMSGNIEKIYGKSLYPIYQLIEDNAVKQSSDRELLKALFNVETSKNFAESSIGQTGLGDMGIIEELGKGKKDTIQETWTSLIEHYEFYNEITMSAKVMQDAKMGSLAKARGMATQFGAAYPRSQVKHALAALSGGENGLLSKNYAFGGKGNLSRTTGDGEALFSTNHKIKKTGRTVSNVFSDTLDDEGKLIDYLVNYGRNMPNESGEIGGYLFDTIILPGNKPALERTVKQLISTDRVLASNDNNMNTQEGLFNFVVAKYWIANDDETPFLLMSTDANKELSGNMFFNRTSFEINQEIDLRKNVTMASYARWGVGFFDWKHILAAGVKGGKKLI